MRVPTIIPTIHLVLTKSDEGKGAKGEVVYHCIGERTHHTDWLLTVAPTCSTLLPSFFCPPKEKGFSEGRRGRLELNLLFTGLGHQSPIKLPYPFPLQYCTVQATKHPWPGTGGRVIRRQATPHLHRTRRPGRRGPPFSSLRTIPTPFHSLPSDQRPPPNQPTPDPTAVVRHPLSNTCCCRCPCARTLSSENHTRSHPRPRTPHAGLVLGGRETERTEDQEPEQRKEERKKERKKEKKRILSISLFFFPPPSVTGSG